MTKNLITVLFMLCVVGAMLPHMTTNAKTSGNYEYAVQEDGTVWITSYKGKAKTVKIPSKLGNKKVTGIADMAFFVQKEVKPGVYEDASTVTKVVFPDTLTYIGNWNFYQLKSIEIPASVTYIGSRAFGTEHVKSIKVASGNTVYDSRNNCNAIIETATDTLYRACNYTKILNGIKVIGDDSFSDYSKTSVKIPNTVESIGYCAFMGCEKLKSVKIPDMVTYVGGDAFYGCKNLTTVTIGKNVKTIGFEAFKDCAKLKNINIKSTELKKIEKEAFSGCKKLTKITLKTTKLTKKSIGKNAIKGTNAKLVIKVPAKKVSAYKKYFKNKGNKTVKVKK